jgi:phospholipase D-like protein
LFAIDSLGENVEIVLTQGEHGYADVLTDARVNGGELFIVAFAITTKGDEMLRILQKGIPGVARIEFVTAIPKFHQRDWCGDWGEKASKEIEEYLALLHPEALHASVTVAIVMESHAKMAISERLGYVGSANFSDASADKKEAGVLIRDADAVQQVRAKFKEAFAADIYPYKPDADSLLEAWALLGESRMILTTLTTEFEGYSDPETEEFELRPDDVDVVRSWTSKAATALEIALEVVDGDALDLGGVERPAALDHEIIRADFEALECNDLRHFVRFSRDQFVEDRVQELTAQDPENLDGASEQANQEADEELSERFARAWPVIEPILDRLKALPEALQTAMEAVRRGLDGLKRLRV